MNEVIINAHIHTRFSDGMKTHREIAEIAARHSLDAVLISDHNVFPQGVSGYYQFNKKHVLVIIGEEIHDVNRVPQKNHLLGFGIDKSYTKYAPNPQTLINEITGAGGLAFLAHAYDPALPAFGNDDLSWVDWNISGYTGIELWNNLSEFKIRYKNKLQAYFYAVFPSFLALEPPIQIRKLWDQLILQCVQLTAIGGSDAHTLPNKIGPFNVRIFRYDYHFRTINNHLLMDDPMSGEPKKDQIAILNTIKSGRLFIANDQIFSTRGFRCWVENDDTRYQMGEKVPFEPGIVLQAEIPARADCCILKNGKRIHSYKKVNKFSYSVMSKGIYRIECYRRFRMQKRGWIFTNPFYIS